MVVGRVAAPATEQVERVAAMARVMVEKVAWADEKGVAEVMAEAMAKLVVAPATEAG